MPELSLERDERPPRFVRTRRGRLVGGVCSGLGAQLHVDPLLPRIVFVGLIFFGGAGFWLYLAMLLLTPEEGSKRAPIRLSLRALPAIAGVLIVLAALGIALSQVRWGTDATPGVVSALGVLAVIGVSGRYACRRLHAAARRSEPRSADLRLAGIAAGVLAFVAEVMLFALVGAWLAGIDRDAAAWAVAGTGIVLIAAALAHSRRLLAPALALAAAVAVFTAARVDLHGGFGARVYRPQALSALRSDYALGAGRLEVDLRGVALPPGETRMRVRLGVGEAVIVVPDEVCVATHARLGGGYVGALDRETDGLDVNWSRPPARATRTRVLLLEGNVGLGALFVVDRPLSGRFEPGLYGTNSACRGVA
jgi:phage shock protein PspC (stress-responsive transcriptional regulator)